MGREKDADCRLCRRSGQKLLLKGSKCYSDKCAFGSQNAAVSYGDNEKEKIQPPSSK